MMSNDLDTASFMLTINLPLRVIKEGLVCFIHSCVMSQCRCRLKIKKMSLFQKEIVDVLCQPEIFSRRGELEPINAIELYFSIMT